MGCLPIGCVTMCTSFTLAPSTHTHTVARVTLRFALVAVAFVCLPPRLRLYQAAQTAGGASLVTQICCWSSNIFSALYMGDLCGLPATTLTPHRASAVADAYVLFAVSNNNNRVWWLRRLLYYIVRRSIYAV